MFINTCYIHCKLIMSEKVKYLTVCGSYFDNWIMLKRCLFPMTCHVNCSATLVFQVADLVRGT